MRAAHHTTMISSSNKHHNVASHPRFNRRGGDKSNSPDQDYSEGHFRQTLASTTGTRSVSRVTSTKGPRNNQAGLTVINSSTQKSIVTGNNNAKKTPVALGAYTGFGNMPINSKRPKSSAAYTKKYKPFNQRAGMKSNNQINFNNYGSGAGTQNGSRTGMTQHSSSVNINQNP